MRHTRPLPMILLAAVLFAVGCARSADIAVIAMDGLPADARYLEPFADSLLQSPHPVRVEIFNAPGAGGAYRVTLQRAESIAKLPGLVGVVGHRDSRSTLVVGPVYVDAGIPLVVPNATSRAISHMGPMVFQMVADDDEEGAFLANVAAKRLGGRRISIFYLSDEYGVGIYDGTVKALEEEGIEPWSVTEYGLQRDKCPGDFKALVDASLLKGLPDVVILGSRIPDAACIVRLVGARAPHVRFVAADGVDPRGALRTQAGKAADRLWVTQFWNSMEDSASAVFARQYERRTGVVPNQGAALRWDGVRVLVAAVREVGPDPRRIAEYLRELGRSRPPYHGITGDISFGQQPHRLMLVDAWGRPVPSSGS
ncbi:MAG: branched-chain amino acid ABC transporter substrate-binding protein [Gemmatimonadetes bacterium]|nr:branched-chain amino acid ABC transporter substrate-binding protein [Gemmatimonadota bacterium]